jgi:DDE family transposase
MSRQRGSASGAGAYPRQLRQAMSMFLPAQGLALLSADDRVRWTPRLLTITALLTAWSGAKTLMDRFNEAREAAVAMHPTRRRPGKSAEGFFKALEHNSPWLLGRICDCLRKRLIQIAGAHWKIDGWLLFGVDGSKFDCPRTAANETGFGTSGRSKSGPQQLLTCLFHIGSGVLWGWSRDGVQGRGEPTQLKGLLCLLPPQAMLLADAAFTGYELLKMIQNRGNHFLIRVGSNVKLIRKLGYIQREGKQTVYLWPLNKQGRGKRTRMPKGLDRVAAPLVLRLIELRDRQGKSVYLLTNVSRKILSDRAAAKMYRLRWGIEVMWRGLKQTMGHHTLLSQIPSRCGVELDWAMAGLWMLQMLTMPRTFTMPRKLTASPLNHAGQCPPNRSPAQALRVVRQAMRARRRPGKSLAEQLGVATQDTYRRRHSKQARYRREKRPQRPPGRPEARMASALEKRIIQRILEQPPPKSFAA